MTLTIRRSFAELPPAANPTSDDPAPGACRHAFDSTSYDAHVRPHLPAVLAAARRVLGSHDLAWDAVQEALLALWRQPRLPADVERWLVAAARLRCRYADRTERRRRHHETCVCSGRPELRPEDDPARLSELEDGRAHLARAVATLPVGQRDVVRLRRTGLEYGAIAHVLRVPVGTVRSRLARARATLTRGGVVVGVA